MNIWVVPNIILWQIMLNKLPCTYATSHMFNYFFIQKWRTYSGSKGMNADNFDGSCQLSSANPDPWAVAF